MRLTAEPQNEKYRYPKRGPISESLRHSPARHYVEVRDGTGVPSPVWGGW